MSPPSLPMKARPSPMSSIENKPPPLGPKLAPDQQGLIYLPHEAFAAAFAQNASVEELIVLEAVQRPLSPACISVKMGRPLWKEVPVWFLVAEEDRMIVHETHRFMAQRMRATVRSYPVDHTPMVTAPDLVIDIVREAIGEAVRMIDRSVCSAAPSQISSKPSVITREMEKCLTQKNTKFWF